MCYRSLIHMNICCNSAIVFRHFSNILLIFFRSINVIDNVSFIFKYFKCWYKVFFRMNSWQGKQILSSNIFFQCLAKLFSEIVGIFVRKWICSSFAPSGILMIDWVSSSLVVWYWMSLISPQVILNRQYKETLKFFTKPPYTTVHEGQ